MGEVAGAAHFWVMRSCKYEKVHKAEQRQTKQLCIRYIAFNKDGITLTHDSSSLHLADCVWSRSNDRKNDRKADTITQWKTSNELPCPVKIWASIIVRIMSYKGANNKSPVSLVKHKSKIINVTGEMIADLCRDGIVTIGETKLRVCRWEIRTRSICAGADMAMYLARVLRVFSIMLIGRCQAQPSSNTSGNKYRSFHNTSPQK